jgi:hypothetical protein
MHHLKLISMFVIAVCSRGCISKSFLIWNSVVKEDYRLHYVVGWLIKFLHIHTIQVVQLLTIAVGSSESTLLLF